MIQYKPPFATTDEMTLLVNEINGKLSQVAAQGALPATAEQRKADRIRSIHATLAIENNTLTIDQMTAIIDDKRVLGNPLEIREVCNAYTAYELMHELDPLSVDDLLRAHGAMMAGLVIDNGQFRSRGVGVFSCGQLVHMAPPAKLVPGQIADLIEWYRRSRLHPLVRSSVFHYELEYIHPFSDGNGRMGRMWHTLLLGKWKELFYWLPVEELIQTRQDEYYSALAKADRIADSACFVELMLEIIRDSLKRLSLAENDTDQVDDQVTDQVGYYADDNIKRLLALLGSASLSAVELMEGLGLKHRPAFRQNYLDPALRAGLIERTIPDKPNSNKQKYRRVVQS